MKVLVKVLIIIFIISSQNLNAQEKVETSLDTFFNAIEKEGQGSGQVSVFVRGVEAYHTTFGYSDWEKKLKNTEHTVFRIGSVTKMYTAAIIIQLIEEGRLSLEDTLSSFFPELPNATTITIAHLLKHQSGLRDITMDENFTTWMLEPQTAQLMLGRMVNNGTVFQPGTDTGYCNTNYILLGYIAEHLESKPISEIVHSRIVTPLKLNKTTIGVAINPTKNEALSHNFENGSWQVVQEYTDMSAPSGAGAIVSTATEVNTFTHALFTSNLVSKKSLQQMCDVSSGMGMGFGGREVNGVQFYGMSGQIDGFKSFAIVIPSAEMSITILTNGYEGSPQDAVLKIAQTYLGAE